MDTFGKFVCRFGISKVSMCSQHAYFRFINHRYCHNSTSCIQESPASRQNGGPLSGIRVLDLTRVLAGPYCSMILADLGAEVIKVERPGVGDDTRTWGPPFVGTESAYFLCVNRNKKSIAIDLKKHEGAQIIKQLCKSSDIFIENYLPGKLSEMGLGYQQLHIEAPHIIYCSISGYGQSGPDAQKLGYDVIVSGAGGLMHSTGPQDGDPCKVGVAMTDLSTGLYAYGSVLAALHQRHRTGQGQHIDCNLLSTQVASMVNLASNYLNSGMEAKRHGTAHQSIVPYQAFKTSNGYVLIGAGNDKQFKELCQKLDVSSLSDDPDYINNQQRVKNRQELLSRLSNIIKKKSTASWMDILKGSSLPFGPINNMQQVFSDPQVLHNGMLQELQHPAVGTVRVPGPAVRFSESNPPPASPPPSLGEHTEDILSNILGHSHETIRKLYDSGVVG